MQLTPAHLGSLLVGLILAVGWGPLSPPIPGVPHIKIKDVPDEMFEGKAMKLEGPLAPNTRLHQATVLFNNTIIASESVLPSEDGTQLVMIDRYGSLWTASYDASAPGQYLLDSATPRVRLPPGRPLGFKRDRDGNIVVCVAGGGLVRVELGAGPAGSDRVVTLASHVSADSPEDANTPILYANDLDISSDGVIYFTDAQAVPVLPKFEIGRLKGSRGSVALPYWDTLRSYLLGVYAGSVSGRLLAYYPNNGSVHVLAKGFWFSNGVALSADESSVVFAETNRFRLIQYFLTGEKAGRLEELIANLPGNPDGVDRATDGSYWVALPAKKGPLFEAMKYKIFRVLVAWLPFTPPLPKWGAVIKVSPEGNITEFLQDPNGSHVSFLTAAEESHSPDGSGRKRLFMGSVRERYVAYIDL